MQDKIVVANWKANKNLEEAIFWVEEIGTQLISFKKKIILAAPFVFLVPLAEKIKKTNFASFLFLSSQNISHFSQGAYTGEVTAAQLSGLVKFTLVGHSERRRYFGETKEQIFKKVNLAKQFGITPILCFDKPQIEEVFELQDPGLICAYEPITAIGTGNPETPTTTAQIVQQVKLKNGKSKVLYGGSVEAENVGKFLAVSDGVLIGTASLAPANFLTIISKIP